MDQPNRSEDFIKEPEHPWSSVFHDPRNKSHESWYTGKHKPQHAEEA